MDRSLVALVALLCGMLVVGSALAGGWLRSTAQDMAAQIFDDASWHARQLRVVYAGVTDGQVPADAGARLSNALDPALRTILAPPRHSVSLGGGTPQALPRRTSEDPLFLGLAGVPDARDQVRILEGRFPRSGARVERLPRRVAAAYDGPPTAPVVEVALHRRSSSRMNLPVGTYVVLDSRALASSLREQSSVLRITGTYLPDVARPAPLDDVPLLRAPSISDIPGANVVRGAALAADPGTVLEAPWAELPEVAFTFDPSGTPTVEEMGEVAAQARSLGVQAWPSVLSAEASAGTTGVGELAETFLDKREASNALAVLALAALAAAALTTLVVAASVLEARRREVTEVLRARGASTPRLLAMRAGEALVVVSSGVVFAAALSSTSWIAFPDLWWGGAVAVTCVLVLATVQVPPWALVSDRVRLATSDALQLAVVLLAVTGTVLLVQRGDLDAGDPLLLVLPGVVGVSAGVVVVRSVRLLTRAARRGLAGGTGLGPIVALSQAGAATARAGIPVAAVVLAGAAMVVSLAVGDTLHRAAERTAWTSIGADVAVSGGGLDGDLVQRLAELPGVEAVAPVVHSSTASLETRVGARRVTVVAVEPERLARVRADAPQELAVPDSDGSALRVLVSEELDLSGDRTSLDYAGRELPVEVVERVVEVPGVSTEGPIVVVGVEALRTAVDRVLSSYDTVLLSGSPDPGAVTRLVREVSPLAEIRTREAVTTQALAAEVVDRTLGVVRAVTIGATGIAVLAALLAAGLGGPGRRRTRSLLHDLGAHARVGRRATAVELAPVLLGAAAAALACGALLTVVIRGGVDLAALTGLGEDLVLALDPGSWGAAAAGCLGLVVLVAVISAGEGWSRAPGPRRPRRPSRPGRPGRPRGGERSSSENGRSR